MAAAAAAEAIVTGSRAWATSPRDAALAGLWTLGLWAVPISALALGLSWLLALAADDGSLSAALRFAWIDAERRERGLLHVLATALLLTWVFAVARAAAGFHNVELGAALVAVLACLGQGLLAALRVAALRALSARREAGEASPHLPWAVLVASLGPVGWVVFSCRGGLLQLDARLLAAPLALVVAFLLCDASELVRRLERWLVPALAALFAGGFVALLAAGDRAAATLVARGAWSPWLVAGLQRASDFDHDGYSSWLGGGDCAPFDAAINPGAAEQPGDGVDNNCIGGDGGKAWSPRRPTWGAAAHGSPNLNVVIVTIETLRRDHASFVGSLRDTTPNLRKLSRESLVFEHLYSAAPLTRLSVASLFSSFTPSEIDWLPQDPARHMRRIGPSTPWLPELLRARGYETIAVLTNFSAFTPQEDAGFERGFQHYDISTRLEYRGGTMSGFPAAEQVDKALGYLQQVKAPFLLWLHLFEPHYRYEQPPDAPQFGPDEQARYDAEIWHVDRQLGRLVQALRDGGMWDSTLLFVSGDHGEAFGEHDDRWHGSNLFDPQLTTAALLRVPGVSPKRVGAGVSLTDIAPTLLRVLGERDAFGLMHGRSLTPLLHHRSLPPDDDVGFVSETFAVEDGRSYQAAYVKYPLKLVYVEQGRQFSFFDLAADPGEHTPLEPATDPRALPLLAELVGYLEHTRPRSLAP
jgi:arylsulfatase A-like enzyme